MYGTVARMVALPGKGQDLVAWSNAVNVPGIPGLVTQHVYQMDANPDEYYLAVVFESKDAYLKNAASPESHAAYEQYRAFLAQDPEWHDGEIVYQA